MNHHTSESLKKFEKKILDLYQTGKIQSPIHLCLGNEDQLIDVFREVKEQDWIFTTWRSHYHCLLKGVPESNITQRIVDGFSITLCFPEYKIYSSAIVGGIAPIAVGTALDIKRRGANETVWCFLGDTASETGIAYESIKYARQHQLPMRFVIEDNGQAITTNTRQAWNQDTLTWQDANDEYVYWYQYINKYPHSGGPL
jgi:pyruvate dehydrogenase E1 component alpha subunit